jgi:hypothetical protein
LPTISNIFLFKIVWHLAFNAFFIYWAFVSVGDAIYNGIKLLPIYDFFLLAISRDVLYFHGYPTSCISIVVHAFCSRIEVPLVDNIMCLQCTLQYSNGTPNLQHFIWQSTMTFVIFVVVLWVLECLWSIL